MATFHKKVLVNLYFIVFTLIGLLPRNKKVIIFESYSGKQFSCNPRAIYEYLEKNKEEYNYKLIWSIDKRKEKLFKDLRINYLKRFSLKWLWYMATAKFWITNSRLPYWIPKPSKTVYIQTWHGTPLKKLACDMNEVYMPGTTTIKYKRNFIKEASKWNYLISPNAYSSQIFKRAFQFSKTIIEFGYPRNDYLINNNNKIIKASIKKKLNIPTDKKVILYAPTWRDDQFYEKGSYKFVIDLDLHKLKEKLGNDFVIILRMHYLIAECFDFKGIEEFAYDLSAYEDIRDLYIISDILITDYSSVMFDFAILRRPMIFFVPDIQRYRDKLRGFYFDFEKYAPGMIVQTTEETIKAINQSISSNNISITSESFYEKFCGLESGQVTERVVKSIL